MCIIVDTNLFHKFFNKNNQDFSLVDEWMDEEHVPLVYGGTKYNSELRKAHKYLGIFEEYKKIRKAYHIIDNLVDLQERIVLQICPETNVFDDQHLVALVRVTKSRLVMTEDPGAERLLKNRRLYNRGIRRPKIYKRREHNNLLNRKNVVTIDPNICC